MKSFSFLLILVAALCPVFPADIAEAATIVRYFEISDGNPSETFVIALTDPSKIQYARAIVAGQTGDKRHISGKIVKSSARYNANWKFHLSPSSIVFQTFAPTTCGRFMNASDVQSRLDDVGKPGDLVLGFWCPVRYDVVSELP